MAELPQTQAYDLRITRLESATQIISARRKRQVSFHTQLALPLVSLAVIAVAWWWLGLPADLVRAPIDPNNKLQCISYAPFRNHQTSLSQATQVSREQIAEDLAQLAQISNCVRTYATDLGLDEIPELAAKQGLKVIQGIFLDKDRQKNSTQISTAVRLAKQYPDTIIALVVGNETLLRKDITASDLAATLRSVKSQVDVPVTYADVWEFWLSNRELYDSVDFVTVHILPYWENVPIRAESAAAHVGEIRRRIASEFPGKEILIGEIGWPSAGRMRDSALPSPVNQARVVSEILDLAQRENFRVNLFEAYDESWKREIEGTVGGSWGLFDAEQRSLKYPPGAPISNFPTWKLQMGIGMGLAILIFGAAWLTLRLNYREPGLVAWFAVAISATTSGILFGVATQKIVYESYGATGWPLWGSLLLAATVSPLFGAAALMSGRPSPTLLELLGPAFYRTRSTLAILHGVSWIATIVIGTATAIGLVFDPRFVDFPYAALTMAAVPFAAVMLINPVDGGVRPMAESIYAGVFLFAAIYVGFNEGPANWQSLWTCAAYLILAVTLWRVRVHTPLNEPSLRPAPH
ncbi:beta-(1-6) glucans synthase [Bradyrhizobium sp.]|jgi:glucan 1,3-beta-glucosidase|uniref:glycoside hydrolase family 17 protein n=1 Tax=Bradyrhizobium sp. TaxID=376 RepID=UPI002DDC9310|nr:beta-(1-6) glucans synthase [Bradyrhizobium sp.]HEV2153941.1 beta-(1-6) glucans synthase [Bradyrhizobium sp.]